MAYTQTGNWPNQHLAWDNEVIKEAGGGGASSEWEGGNGSSVLSYKAVSEKCF